MDLIDVIGSLILDHFELSQILIFASVCKRYYTIAVTYWKSRSVTIPENVHNKLLYVSTTRTEHSKHELWKEQLPPGLCLTLYIPQHTRKLTVYAWMWYQVFTSTFPCVEILNIKHSPNHETTVNVQRNNM